MTGINTNDNVSLDPKLIALWLLVTSLIGT